MIKVRLTVYDTGHVEEVDIERYDYQGALVIGKAVCKLCIDRHLIEYNWNTRLVVEFPESHGPVLNFYDMISTQTCYFMDHNRHLF